MTGSTYSAAVFEVPDEAAARRIILTPESGQDTNERWTRETPYLVDLLATQVQLSPQTVVVDYGCGIGRMSKAIIERFGCQVLGVDLSERMRSLAPGYVGSPLFSVVSPEMFRALGKKGLRADAAISIWVLQQCAQPQDDLARIADALRPDAPFFLVNNEQRAVPTSDGLWADDGVRIADLAAARFEPLADGRLDPGVVPPSVSEQTFWATYVRRGVAAN